ncbi:MAG: hypothetical protein OEM63_05865 [Gammaproteobacteria bacterium]|nr:hypothetical protein [Gammaproteobacteria bacterium]
MADSQALDDAINKAAFRTAVVLILAGVLSAFFPLDAPEGPFAERMQWYSSNVGAYVIGWVVQMIAMLTLSGVFAATAWQTRKSNPLSSFLAGTAVLMATVAFIIPKFIAIWSIPQIVAASSNVTANAAVAEQLFQLLNPSLSFSLFTSFDYLGFWMYGVFGLLVTRPLFRLTLSAKIAAVALGLFGLLYHALFIGVMAGSVATADIGPYAESMGILLLIPIISMAIYFRSRIKEASSA